MIGWLLSFVGHVAPAGSGLAGLALAGLAFAGFGGIAMSGPARAQSPTACAVTDETARLGTAILRNVNRERAAAGLRAVAGDPRLAAAAQAHACDIAVAGRLSHRGSDGSRLRDRMRRAGYAFSKAAENVAMGQRGPDQVVASWMGSAGHRANILDPQLTALGAGHATGGNRPYWVIVLGASR